MQDMFYFLLMKVLVCNKYVVKFEEKPYLPTQTRPISGMRILTT